jgi:serine/threonine protein kinase
MVVEEWNVHCTHRCPLSATVLLCGCLPFDDDSATIPSDDIVKIKFQLRYPRWAKNLSPSAKDLLSKLLNVDPKQRYSAEQALDHPWVKGETAPKGNLLASPGRIKKSPVRFSGNRTIAPKRNLEARLTPPTTDGRIVRKSSI